MEQKHESASRAAGGGVFYGWYIVAVGILVNIAGTFAFSSTLSIFLKPITEELGVSRGTFSLIRTFEIGIAALVVPLLGSWIDRYGGRGVLVLGVLMEGAGLFLSGLVQSFWQFALVRCSLVIAGEALLGSLVINVTIAQWFVRKRGRAMGIANLGTGIAKFTIPLLAASLFVLIGWRGTWMVFGTVAPLLVAVPALIFVRRSPEDMGLYPDGEPARAKAADPVSAGESLGKGQSALADDGAVWRRSEVLRLPAFWLLVITFGIASIGIAGLNLHIFSYITDIGHTPLVAASFMSTIAITQLGSTLVWGTLADRFDVRKVSCVQFLIQAAGLIAVIASGELYLTYAGFFLYGTGLAGSFVLREVIWANFFGRRSLGTVRGLSLFFSHLFAAGGAPFFGFLHDRTGSYELSFILFAGALFTSAILILLARPPVKTTEPPLRASIKFGVRERRER
ncbi:MAG TPA: MFS transporter [Candidatus Binatia bacterium]|nr:MFS transporter [Candidatus Binatia bacterium]